MRKTLDSVTTNPVKETDLQLNKWFFASRLSPIMILFNPKAKAAFFAVICLMLFYREVAAQDSTRVLPEVTVQAYRYNRPLVDVPVAMSVIRASDLQRFDNTSLLPVVNTLPGIRMEERSPGSFRFSIRGSLIRSPFGVRNVKVYWNHLPLTDGGGNTYLNLFDLSSIGKLEIIKGPGGSLYGAGTGGVMLFTPPRVDDTSIEISSTIGSFGSQRYLVGGQFTTGKLTGRLYYSRQSSDGYRRQTQFHRDAINSDWTYTPNATTTLHANIFFTDVFYETPGGLTLAQFESDPRQARPAAGPNRSAEEQKASVRNMTSFAGVGLDKDLGEHWVARLGAFASYTDFENYAIGNYEHRYETNVGSRLEAQYSFGEDKVAGKITSGMEYQLFESPVNVFRNNLGEVGEKTIGDKVNSNQYFVFLQAELDLPAGINITVGASENFLKYDLRRMFPSQENVSKKFNGIFSPRAAILKKLGPQNSVFASVSSGFSPPTAAEVRPSANAFNPGLAAERGINTEVGIKGKTEKITYELVAYDFKLKETIVLQRVVDGSEFFTNAGKTRQRGLEAYASFSPGSTFKVWGSYSYNHYRFRDYVKDGADYSGNKLTGVAPTTASIGVDVFLKNGLYVSQTNSYTDHLPLNDANDEFAKEFVLSSVRVGWMKIFSGLELDVFGGVNNIFDQTYSLGNDLNAFGRRYYNAAPGRNYFAGIKVKQIFKRR